MTDHPVAATPAEAPPWATLAVMIGLNLIVIALVAWLSAALLGWPFSFGAPLFIQALFFMGHCAMLAELTPLAPAHRSLQNLPAGAAIARMERLRQQLRAVDTAGGAAAIVLGLVALIAPSIVRPTTDPLPLAAASVLLALGFAMVAHGMTLAARSPAQAYLRHAGRIADARVVRVDRAGFTRPSSSYDQVRQYRLELAIMPPDAPPFTATVEQLVRVHPSRMPQPGAMIKVKYLPELPGLALALLDVADRQQGEG